MNWVKRKEKLKHVGRLKWVGEPSAGEQVEISEAVSEAGI